jgi:LysM repeat protein
VQKPGLIILISLLFLSLVGNAQESPVIENRSTTIQRVDGKEYFFHAVLQGQTLFSIAKAYGVSVEDVLKENPELRNQDLRYDQIIRIPVKQQPAVADGQPQSSTITEITYTEHRVRRRETVYGISRMYNIKESDLLEHNPQIRSGLSTNMVLRIPKKKEVTVYYEEYVVKPRQTLFSISRELGVSISELENLNPELKDGLKAGQILKTPVDYTQQVQPPFIKDPLDRDPGHESGRLPVVADPYCSNPETKSHYNVALLIPLYLDNLTEEGFVSTADQEKSFGFLEYYEGIMIALDSVRARGADIRLTVYDVGESEAKARTAIWQPEMAKMDLIIGPFFPEVFPMVANFAKDKNIPIVSPLHVDDRALLDRYPLMFQATPDLQTQMNDMAEYIVKNYPEENIIVVHNNQQGVMHLISSYKQALNNGLNRYFYERDSSHLSKLDGYYLDGVYVGERISNVYVINDSLRQQQKKTGNIADISFQQYAGKDNVSEIVYSRDGMETLVEKLDPTRKNIVVSLMGGEAIIANYTRQLSQLRDTFNLVLFGVPQWGEYRSVDANYLQQLNTHIFSPEFRDYQKVHNIDFVRRYRNLNHVEPGVMGFKAAETGMFFFTALMQYGSQFYRCMDFINQNNSANSPFVFRRPLEQGGWENQFVYIYRHENFYIRDVKDSRSKVANQGR